MPPTVDIARPPGAGRAWLIALVCVALVVIGGLYFTREKPKVQISSNELKQTPGAGAWADSEAKPAPIIIRRETAASLPPPSPHLARITPVQPAIRREQQCQPCEARRRLMAAAQASGMQITLKNNTLELESHKKDDRQIAVATKPSPPHTLVAWTYIPAILETAIDSDHSGDVVARVSQDVFDSVSQTELLIPAGSKIHGTQRGANATNFNDTRLLVTWDDITEPNGANIPIPQMPGFDAAGYSGLSGDVNRHLAAIWGPALLVSAITAGTMLAQQPTYGGYQGYGGMQQASGAFTGSIGNRATQQLNQELGNMRPTITIKAGSAFRILVTHDFVFQTPYEG